MGVILSYLEVLYGIRVQTVKDYLKLLEKASSWNPIDVSLALSAIREFYDSPSFRFLPTFSTPLKSEVKDNYVYIEDEYFSYTYVVEETTKPFVYLDELKVKKELKIEKKKIELPEYLQTNNDLAVLLSKRQRTAYEDYVYALMLVNGGTLPFFYALPFPPSRRIEKVEVEYDANAVSNVIRLYSNSEERDIILVGDKFDTMSFAFGVVR